MIEIEKNIEIPVVKRLIDDGLKKCCICEEIKNIDKFYLEKRGYYSSRCKECCREYDRKHRQTEYGKELHRKHQKRFIEKNPDYDPAYRRSEKGKINGRDSQRRYRENNPNYQKEYFKTEAGKKTQQRANAKRISTPEGKINSNISTAIYQSLRGQKHGRHWESLVEYTLEDLMNHLESQFTKDMSWNNYGNDIGDWSIDHVLPISSFNYESYEDEEFKECWSLINLQPLDHIENVKKSNKVA